MCGAARWTAASSAIPSGQKRVTACLRTSSATIVIATAIETTVRETVVSAPTTQSTPAAPQKQAAAWLRARVARYAASGIAIVSAAPSAIGCWAEARHAQPRPAPRADSLIARVGSRNEIHLCRWSKTS